MAIHRTYNKVQVKVKLCLVYLGPVPLVNTLELASNESNVDRRVNELAGLPRLTRG